MNHEDQAREQVVNSGRMERERSGELEPTTKELNEQWAAMRGPTDFPVAYREKTPRLNRDIPWKKQGDGLYSTADAKHGVQRQGRKWAVGVHQPYHFGNGSSSDDYDFHAKQTFGRLQDAQKHVEEKEAEMPRRAIQDLPFHDRRGL